MYFLCDSIRTFPQSLSSFPWSIWWFFNWFIERLHDEIPSFYRDWHFHLLKLERNISPLPWWKWYPCTSVNHFSSCELKEHSFQLKEVQMPQWIRNTSWNSHGLSIWFIYVSLFSNIFFELWTKYKSNLLIVKMLSLYSTLFICLGWTAFLGSNLLSFYLIYYLYLIIILIFMCLLFINVIVCLYPHNLFPHS